MRGYGTVMHDGPPAVLTRVVWVMSTSLLRRLALVTLIVCSACTARRHANGAIDAADARSPHALYAAAGLPAEAEPPVGAMTLLRTEQNPPAPASVPDDNISRIAEANYRPDLMYAVGAGTGGAVTQPPGALSGVVVYCSGGHGWTADNVADGDPTDLSWFLQRSIQWQMDEDYGNLDQLNAFVRFAFSAGATVVPFRPVGYQTNEVVLDNDDPGVTYAGTWADGTGSKYYENNVTVSGTPYKTSATTPTQTATARFTPNIPQAGFYPVYCFALAGTNRVAQIYRIQHSGGVTEVTVDHREVGNGWVYLGEYYLEAGTGGYVEISNASPTPGVVVADAIRWGNGIGDIVRPGPGTVSGFPRDEECHRYWAQSELGNNAVGFTASQIWDSSSSDDQSDNISTASRWAREMNQVPAGGVLSDRWKRIYVEFHSNAFNGAARGCIGLVSASAPTTNQATYATFMSDEIDADMLLLDATFEHPWFDRASPTLTAEFGAISTTGNSNEFDATIVEVAFHDNQQDAELLRDSRVRQAVARSSVQGIVRFLSTLAGSGVAQVFAPDKPQNIRVVDDGGGNVTLSWDAPVSNSAVGDPATGYVVYSSTNGFGFGVESTPGNVLTATISNVPVGRTQYFRVAATNAGGQSPPSETVAVRRPASGTATVLIVNGFDRLRRFQNPTQDIGGIIERQIPRRTNAMNYVVQFAQALESTTVGFASCVNEAVIDQQIALGDYDIVLWNSGTESTEDATFNSSEQTLVTTFLQNGGAIFVSGSNVGFDLVGQSNGVTFYQDTLGAAFVTDNAGTVVGVTATGAGIFTGVADFDFSSTNGAPYVVYTPDEILPQTGATAALTYQELPSGGGTAAIQFDSGVYRTVVFGFPFETITSAGARADVMQKIIAYLESAAGTRPFDFDPPDGVVDLNDYAFFAFCLQGPGVTYPDGNFCLTGDGDGDKDVDFADFALFQQAFDTP